MPISMTDSVPAPEPQLTVLRYAAFTRDPDGGNPAGVVLDAAGLDEAAMLAVAADVGYSETAFLVPVGPPAQGRYDVRYFSPVAEVPFCGHATIAAAVAVADTGADVGDLVFATRSGDVPVTVERDADGSPAATLTSVEPHVEDVDPGDEAQALSLLGWAPDELDPALPTRIAYAGARHLVVAAATRARLADLRYDVPGLTELMHRLDLTTVQLVWRRSADTFDVRNPFPVGGVYEDPATGAAAAAFGCYLRSRELVPSDAVVTLRQGEDMGRPAVLTVRLRDGDSRVRVTGNAVRIS